MREKDFATWDDHAVWANTIIVLLMVNEEKYPYRGMEAYIKVILKKNSVTLELKLLFQRSGWAFFSVT